MIKFLLLSLGLLVVFLPSSASKMVSGRRRYAGTVHVLVAQLKT